MRVYVSSEIGFRDRVRELYAQLEARGHSVTEKWTEHSCVLPYDSNPILARGFARADVSGVLTSDVFIHLADRIGMGMYAELGLAIGARKARGYGWPKIYVVGETINQSQFYFYDTVERRSSIENVFDEIDRLETLKPQLFVGISEEDTEAWGVMQLSRIPHHVFTNGQGPTPRLIANSEEFLGIDKIKGHLSTRREFTR